MTSAVTEARRRRRTTRPRTAEDELEAEEDAGNRRIERRRDAHPPRRTRRGAEARSRTAALAQVSEPSAEPICTIGPSRPTDPPDPMQSAEANDFTTPTAGSMRPPRCATATMTSGTPWPPASGAKRAMSGPKRSPPRIGYAKRYARPSQGSWGCDAPARSGRACRRTAARRRGSGPGRPPNPDPPRARWTGRGRPCRHGCRGASRGARWTCDRVSGCGATRRTGAPVAPTDRI